MTLRLLFGTWSVEDREALGTLLGLAEVPTADVLERGIWELFNGALGRTSRLSERANKKLNPKVALLRKPDYEQILEMGCKYLRSYERGASLAELEQFFAEGLLVSCLAKSRPRQRSEILRALELLGNEAHVAAKPQNYVGEAAFTVARAAAASSGFQVYLLATTLLGAVTEAIGVTLPFAAYTTLTTTISLAIGPLGLLATAIPIALKLSAPDWKKLLGVILFIIQVRSRPESGAEDA